MSEGVRLSEDFARRLARALKWVERHMRLAERQAAPLSTFEEVFVRCTSSTADGNGNYPGTITARESGTWVDYGAVKLRGPNSEALTSGTRYPAVPSGEVTGGDQLYITADTPSSGGSITFSAVDGNPTGTITTLKCDEAGGVFTVAVATGTGTFTINAANGTTTPGYVSTGTQSLGGAKTFTTSPLSCINSGGAIVAAAADAGAGNIIELYSPSGGPPAIRVGGSAGNVGIGLSQTGGGLRFEGGVLTGGNGAAYVAAPAAFNSSGTAGQLAYDSSFFYVCVSANSWRRVAIAGW